MTGCGWHWPESLRHLARPTSLDGSHGTEAEQAANGQQHTVRLEKPSMSWPFLVLIGSILHDWSEEKATDALSPWPGTPHSSALFVVQRAVQHSKLHVQKHFILPLLCNTICLISLRC